MRKGDLYVFLQTLDYCNNTCVFFFLLNTAVGGQGVQNNGIGPLIF